MSKIATITTVLLLTTLASPLLLAKANKLNFNKSQQSSQQKITGQLLYLNEKNGDVDLLIHDDNRFSYYPHIAQGGLVDKAQIIEIPENAQFFNQAKLAKQASEVIGMIPLMVSIILKQQSQLIGHQHGILPAVKIKY